MPLISLAGRPGSAKGKLPLPQLYRGKNEMGTDRPECAWIKYIKNQSLNGFEGRLMAQKRIGRRVRGEARTQTVENHYHPQLSAKV